MGRAADMQKKVEICERASDDAAAASYAAATASFEAAALICGALERLSDRLKLAIDESNSQADGRWRG
jgi:hypothetical protein